MQSIIKSLYFGDILPFWEIENRTNEYDDKTREIQKNWEEILEKYPGVEPMLEQYRTAHYESENIMGYQQFLLGMKIGAQLMLELLQPVETNKMKG